MSWLDWTVFILPSFCLSISLSTSLYIYVGGKRPGSSCQYLRWAKSPVQGKTFPRSWEEPSSAMDVADDKGSNLLLVVTLRVIPRNRKSTKTENDNRENGNVWGKGCHYYIQCLVPDLAILFCLYNYSQQLEGRADGTSISTRNPIQEGGKYYKRGWRETEVRRAETPITQEAPEKAHRTVPRANPLW